MIKKYNLILVILVAALLILGAVFVVENEEEVKEIEDREILRDEVSNVFTELEDKAYEVTDGNDSEALQEVYYYEGEILKLEESYLRGDIGEEKFKSEMETVVEEMEKSIESLEDKSDE